MLSLSPYQSWSMWAITSLFYAYQYVLRVLPNIIMPELLTHFNTNAVEFGQFAGLYYIGYVGAHIPLGIWLDRNGPKIVVPICILLSVLGIVPLLISDTIAGANIGRFIMGIGSSGAILGAFKVIRLGFPETHFNRMLGLCVTVGLVGALYGGMPVKYLLETTHWQTVVSYFCIFGVALALFARLTIPTNNQPAAVSTHAFKDVVKVIKNKNVIIVSICSGLMLGPLEGFADAWGSGFLESLYNISPVNAAGVTSLIYLGMLFGAPGLTYLADRTGKHTKVIISSGIFMMVAFSAMLMGWCNTQVLSMLLTAVGVCCAYQIIAIYVATTFVNEQLTGLTTAITNMIIMSFGYIFHTSIGFMMGDQQPAGNFTPEQYQVGLSVIPIFLGIGSIGFIIQQARK